MHAPLASLPQLFRQKAETLDPFSPPAATAFRQAAEAVEQALRESEMEPLTLQVAAQESGYSVSHLRRLLSEGKLPDAGGGRVLRRDLPRKPTRQLRTGPARVGSRLQVARAVASERR